MPPTRFRRRSAWLLPTLLAVLLPAAHAAAAGAHVHGQAQVNVALEEPTRALVELLLPALEVVGFERPPRDEADRAAEAEALRRLRDSIDDLVRFDADRDCRLRIERAEMTTVDAAGASRSTHSHSHSHDAGHHHPSGEDGSAAGTHREVQVLVEARCRKPLPGSRLRFGLHRYFPAIQEIEVQVLGPRGQSGHRLRRDEGSVPL